jgi:AbrB family looped-hinge helix DNA binding protein
MKSTVSEKGQVTIPKALRDRLGLRSGTVLEFEERGGALVARKRRGRSPVEAVYGILKGVDVDRFLEESRGPGWNAEQDEPRAKRRR